MTYNSECRFCVLPERWRVVHETRNFVVQAGLGPLSEGYVLVLTRTHLPCFAALDETQLPEFEQVLRLVQRTQIDAYGSSLYFEHGRSGACLPEGFGEDLCYHAHLHLMPTKIDLASLVDADYDVDLFDSWLDVLRFYDKNPVPYVLAQRGDQTSVARTPPSLPKRYLRTKLATAMGAPELADWVAFPSYDVVRRSRNSLAKALAT